MANTRDLYGAARDQDMGWAPKAGEGWVGDEWVKGYETESHAAYDWEGKLLPQAKRAKRTPVLYTREEMVARQAEDFKNRGYSSEDLNIPVYDGKGGRFGKGKDAVLGDLITGKGNDEVQRDLDKQYKKHRDAGDPITNLVYNKYGKSKVDELWGITESGKQVLINKQTKKGSKLEKIAGVAIPAAALTAIGGLGAFGPGGFLTGVPAAGAGGAGGVASGIPLAAGPEIVATPFAAGETLAGLGGGASVLSGTGAAGAAGGSQMFGGIFDPIVKNFTGANLLPTLADIGLGYWGYEMMRGAAKDASKMADPFAGQRGMYQQALQQQMQQGAPGFQAPQQGVLPQMPQQMPDFNTYWQQMMMGQQ